MQAARIKHQLQIGIGRRVAMGGGHLVHLAVVIAGFILRPGSIAQVLAALEELAHGDSLRLGVPFNRAVVCAALASFRWRRRPRQQSRPRAGWRW